MDFNKMGHIKEPEGIDFVVEPSTFTQEERLKISKIIAEYKQQGTGTGKLENLLAYGHVFVPPSRKKTLQ
jgi:hypothetical protein